VAIGGVGFDAQITDEHASLPTLARVDSVVQILGPLCRAIGFIAGC
jgi:hypothetical protein